MRPPERQGARLRALCGLAASLLAGACATAPPVPRIEAWTDPAATARPVADDERALWREAEQGEAELEERGLLYSDPDLDRYLDGVLQALLPGPLPDAAPEPAIRVVRDPRQNAGSLANGTIFVTTSLLAALADEAELAAVIGHELGHFLERHDLARVRYAVVSDSTVARMELARSQERSADRLALELMTRIGYDPDGLIGLLRVLQAEDESQRGPVFEWESHPRIRDRIGDLRGPIADAVAAGGIVSDPAAATARYEEAIADLLPVAAEIELEASLLARARTTLERCLRLRPGNGHAYYLMAEHARRSEPRGHRSEAARRAYERAVALSPDDPEAVRALGLLCREDGDTRRAQSLLAQYLRLAPEAADRPLIERYLRDGEDGE